MKVKEDLSAAIAQYLKHPVRQVLLIIGDSISDFNRIIFDQAMREIESSCFFDLSEAVDIETIFLAC